MKHWADRTIIDEPVPDSAEYDDRQRFTYGQILESAYKLAGWMREQGVDVGDRVAVGGNNSSGWVTSFVAAHLLGAVPVLLNSTL
jgi:acyl-CoA synthetase (AMP-forming)/AMP-acid ligase II